MKKHIVMFLALTFFLTASFAQEVTQSTFDNDEEGWTVNGGNLYYQSENGNPGGFIEFEDNQDGAGVFIVPGKFLGDLSSYHLGSIEFDLKNTLDNGQNLLYGFGNVSISSSVYTASKIVVPSEYLSEWTSFTIPLEAEEWGLSPSAWDSLLSDVTEISVQMDGQWDYYDRSGLDNFTIVPYGFGVGNGPSKIFKARRILNANYPNPFSENTTISWNLEYFANVSLIVCDLMGSEVKALVEEFQAPGYHEITFHAHDMPDGIYLYQIRVNYYCEAKPMILLRK